MTIKGKTITPTDIFEFIKTWGSVISIFTGMLWLGFQQVSNTKSIGKEVYDIKVIQKEQFTRLVNMSDAFMKYMQMSGLQYKSFQLSGTIDNLKKKAPIAAKDEIKGLVKQLEDNEKEINALNSDIKKLLNKSNQDYILRGSTNVAVSNK